MSITLNFGGFPKIGMFLSSFPSRPILFGPLPNPYLTLTRLASLGLSRSHKGTGTDSIFDFSHPPPTTTKLFRSLYSPLGILYLFHTCPLPLPYPSTPTPYLTPPLSPPTQLPIPYLSLTHPLPIPLTQSFTFKL